MAREAGIIDFRDAYSEEHVQAVLEDLKAFEALVRADEQKKWQEQTAVEIHEAVLDEREACAKLFELREGWLPSETVAAAIRARGNT